MKQLSILFTLIVGFGISLPSMAQTYVGTNLGDIPDGRPGNSTSYGAPRDIYFDVGPLRTVTQVSVNFTATHSYVGDLRVTLIGPNGNRQLLFARTGATTAGGYGFNSDLSGTYTFTDNQAVAGSWWSAAANSPVPAGSYRTSVSGGAGVSNPAPATSLSAAFQYSLAAGRWILRFEDGAQNDTGTVTAANLTLTMTGSTRGVSNADDSGLGSLRSAIAGAGTGDVIRFVTPFFASARTINLQSQLDIPVAVAIRGPGADLLTIRRADSAGDMRIFSVAAGGSRVSLSGMTIANGQLVGDGGGIVSISPLTLSGVHITGNRANYGAGLYLLGSSDPIVNSTISGNVSTLIGGAVYSNASGSEPLRFFNTTISGNIAEFDGAGIFIATDDGPSTLELVNSTVADNRSRQASAAGIYVRTNGNGASSALLRNSIIANNSPANFGTVAIGGSADITSTGFNLSNDYGSTVAPLGNDVTGDPRLGPLVAQGGAVPTRLLLGGSAALDAGNNSGESVDQRGLPRTFDMASVSDASNGSDIGAVEMQAIVVTTSSDAGAGSLRAALEAANGNGAGLDDVIFDSGVFSSTQAITLASALPTINSAITISGTGADRLSVRRGGGTPQFRIFTINAELAVAAFSGIKMQGGTITTENGGGILSFSPLTLAGVHLLGNLGLDGGGVALMTAGGTIVDSTISSNSATGRAAGVLLFNGGGLPLRIINSTISSNAATGTDGGIFVLVENNGTASMEIINSTIAQNTATITGGIASVSLGGLSAAVDIRNSIVTDNSLNNLGTFASSGIASITSRGFNLSDRADAAFFNQPTDQNSANAGLAALANNGGSTPTHALLPGSDALDGGDNSGTGVLFDQRGPEFERPIDLALTNLGDGSDVGAFELQGEILSDEIFADDFEGAGSNTDIVVVNNVNFSFPATLTGGSIQWSTGLTCDCDVEPYDFTLWRGEPGVLRFWWPGAFDSTSNGAVALNGKYQVLAPGAVIGPASTFINTIEVNEAATWAAGANGFIGFRFRHPDTNLLNYGWANISTTGPTGFPATLHSYAYDSSGAAITIPMP